MDRPTKLALGSGMMPSSSACVDAETLAAWSDRTLPPAASAAVEAHLADCARCQAMLAAFVASEPTVAVSATVPFWQRWQVRWLAPLAVGTAAVLLWAVVPRNTLPPPAGTMARVETPEATIPATPPSPPVSTRASEQPAPAASPERYRMPAASPASTSDRATAESAASTPSDRTAELSSGQVAAAAPQPDTRASAEAAAASPATELGSARRPTGNVAITVAPAQPRPAPAGLAAKASPTTTIVIEIEPARTSLAQGGASVARAADAVRPAAVPRWRIVASSMVERSLGDGPWEQVAIEGSVTLTGGIALAPSTCWLIGRSGVVLRSTDGVRFERRPFPEPADLSSIRATDDRRAEVTTTDGRVFSTQDAGATWARTP